MRILFIGDGLMLPTLAQLEQLTGSYPDIEVFCTSPANLEDAQLENAELIYGAPPPHRLKAAVNLRWLHLGSAGAEAYEHPGRYLPSSVIITKSNGVYAIPIAEHVLAMFLAFNRKLPLFYRRQLAGQWLREGENRELFGATVGILGYGEIGHALAQRLKPFGCRILAYKRQGGPLLPPADAQFLPGQLHEMLPLCDYLAVCLPATDQTRGLLGREAFASLKPGCVLCNVGRGAVLDTDALLHALQNGTVAFAGLDVTDPEPLPGDSPLWRMDNVLITPHVSGSSLREQQRRFDHFLALLKDYHAGKVPGHRVECGY